MISDRSKKNVRSKDDVFFIYRLKKSEGKTLLCFIGHGSRFLTKKTEHGRLFCTVRLTVKNRNVKR